MISAAVVLLMLLPAGPFSADAEADHEFVIERPDSAIMHTLGDIHMLAQTMPGVTGIEETGKGRWLYRTERRMPFSDIVRTDFVLERFPGRGIIFCTPDTAASNWMLFRVTTRPVGDDRTDVTVHMRVRLTRADATDIHVFAPILGERFISDRMREDLEAMLERFAVRVCREMADVPVGNLCGTDHR